MALCTKCGAIMCDEDMESHKCNAFNLPSKGKIKQPKTTEVFIND